MNVDIRSFIQQHLLAATVCQTLVRGEAIDSNRASLSHSVWGTQTHKQLIGGGCNYCWLTLKIQDSIGL